MTTIHLKQTRFKKQIGAVTLVITVILLVATLLIIQYAASYNYLQTKTNANQVRNDEAFEAAEAGLEYAIANLQTNSATIRANPTNGFINYSMGPTTLGNNASYTVTYTNPTANNYDILTITSTGTSADGSATRVISQQVASGSSLSLQYTVTTQSSMTASGNGHITGTQGIDAGGSVRTSGNWDVSSTTQNDTSLANQSSATLFSNIFGMSQSAMQANSTVYSNGNSLPWSSLSGNTWVNSGISHSGHATIGSPTSPVLLIVNGNFTNSGTFTLYGILYVMGSVNTSGNFSVNGGIVATGPITMSGSAATYNSTIIKNLLGGGGYAKIPGSWVDF